jgi:hypothetical protein
MQMRSLRWNLVTWNPSAGPADPYGAPRFAHLVWTVRVHWRPICLAAGAVFMVTGLMLPSTVVFIAGVVAIGSSVPDARPQSATAATVRTWVWLDKRRAGHR